MIKQEIKSELSEENALNTLASAALEQDFVVSTNRNTPKTVSVSKIPVEIIEPQWYDVGIINGTSCVVNNFYLTDVSDYDIDSDNLPNYLNSPKVELHPGTAYKFRIAAINSCGRGEWSDVSAFKTCLPGFPGAPCSIRVSRVAEGVSLQWEPPKLSSTNIEEYSVCLAIKIPDSENMSLKDVPFVRVYCGPDNYAFVYNESLNAAFIDKSIKPAIIFRIAAKNHKGYGPATQVRWIQDIYNPFKNNIGKENNS